MQEQENQDLSQPIEGETIANGFPGRRGRGNELRFDSEAMFHLHGQFAVRLLNREVLDRVAEVIDAFLDDGGIRRDRENGRFGVLPGACPRHEVRQYQ